ncbi:hypothetical protein, partial [Streptococcus dysgalactiae]|uniref:hypothetical protein n=1 Tax=Streptococcus dysgalactiae TaxID=1334 RepID=UPI0019503197
MKKHTSAHFSSDFPTFHKSVTTTKRLPPQKGHDRNNKDKTKKPYHNRTHKNKLKLLQYAPNLKTLTIAYHLTHEQRSERTTLQTLNKQS